MALWDNRVCARSTQTPAPVHCNSENIGPIMGTLLRAPADFDGTLTVRCDIRCGRGALAADRSLLTTFACTFGTGVRGAMPAGTCSWRSTRLGDGKSSSSVGSAMTAGSRGGPNALDSWLSAVLGASSAGEAMRGLWREFSARGTCGGLGIGRTGRSVLAIDPATAQARIMGSQT